ncbi:3-deoxy-D-manno-octulosonic acid transferase [Thalassobius vesicularis]|uniref:3-deoxy-D-manno-octulosonic acid transferase n=1 Tax=Thalassobius vesicularis TaxID=1294297 RepID=A0A4S3MDM0_9RHOB|nr:glycosyltransferase N-terminal domain-containing protein [Thalassobius vesicularis]THD76702.1 3-deoxy-D-manno-octulosonic acid transferase [Thalassobius vesicularis]
MASLSLAAYLALVRRAPRDAMSFPRERPKGQLIWGHATNLSKAAALLQLVQRLRAQGSDVSLLLTTPHDLPQPDHLKPYVTWQSLPEDNVAEARRFLAHWKPDLMLWTCGNLQPAMIHSTARAGIKMILVDAEEDAFDGHRFQWLPDLTRQVVDLFDHIMASDQAASRKLIRLGLPAAKVAVTGRLQEAATALPCNVAMRDELAETLAGRSLWLAAMVQPEELETILEAHRASLRYSHRQLLVLVPDDETRGPNFQARLEADGWRFATWSHGDMPEETTQILLADTRGEMGLWYRLAPITFMASSLVSGHGGRDPWEPAALGSAILYGPNVGRYLSAYSRLAGAGAARIVRDADTLSAAITRLSAPDQAAIMAHAAWEVSSEGAEATDRLMTQIQDILDRKE